MGLGKTYSTKYLLDSNNSSGVAGQVLSTTSTGIDWVDANTVPGTGLWLASGNNIYNSNSGNVGIGTTNPTQKLHLDGNNYNTATRTTFLIRDVGNNYDQGDNAIDIVMRSRYWSGDQNTSQNSKIRHLKDNSNGSTGTQLRFSTTTRGAGDSSDKMTILASGNVGIGTTSPNDALDVAGNSATTHRIRINNANASGTETLAFVQDTTFKSWVEYNNSTGNFDVWQYTNNPLRFATNNTERMRIDSDGKIQVGSDKVIWAGGYGGALVIRQNNATSDRLIKMVTVDSTGAIVTDNVLVAKGVNVGVGTESPAVKLHIKGAANGTDGKLYITEDASNGSFFKYDGATNRGSLGGLSTGGEGKVIDWSRTGSEISFLTGNSERMRVASNGGVGINTTNPTEKLEVNGNVKVQGNIIVNSDIELGPSSRIQLDDTPTASTASGSGTIVNWSVSDATTAGTLYTVKTNGLWTPVDADNEATSIGMLAIALSSNANLGMLLQGFFYKASHGFTIGLPLYISNTAGAFSTTRPTGTNDYVRIIGYATSANYIYFDPDKTWVQVA